MSVSGTGAWAPVCARSGDSRNLPPRTRSASLGSVRGGDSRPSGQPGGGRSTGPECRDSPTERSLNQQPFPTLPPAASSTSPDPCLFHLRAQQPFPTLPPAASSTSPDPCLFYLRACFTYAPPSAPIQPQRLQGTAPTRGSAAAQPVPTAFLGPGAARTPQMLLLGTPKPRHRMSFHDGGQGFRTHLRQDAISGDGVVDLAMALRGRVARLRCRAYRRGRMPEVHEVP